MMSCDETGETKNHWVGCAWFCAQATCLVCLEECQKMMGGAGGRWGGAQGSPEHKWKVPKLGTQKGRKDGCGPQETYTVKLR